jgi:hypothetical protein
MVTILHDKFLDLTLKLSTGATTITILVEWEHIRIEIIGPKENQTQLMDIAQADYSRIQLAAEG